MIRESSGYFGFLAAGLLLCCAAGAGASTLNVPSTSYPTIQAAIDAATAADTILVAAGTYHESLVWDSKDLILQGAGQGQSVIDPSVASGGPGGRCVVTHNLSAAARMEGFTLRNGNAPLSNGAGFGGGIMNDNSSPAVANCAFVGNTADYGAAMENEFGDPTVTHCTFSANHATTQAGGIRGIYSSLTLRSSTVSENSAGTDGGGMLIFGGLTTVTSCTLSGNSAFRGGGTHNVVAAVHLTNCTFGGNSAAAGGGIYNDSSFTALTNCTLSGNSATYGGGMYNYFGSNPAVTNSIFWGDYENEIYNDESLLPNSPVVTYSDVQGGHTGTGNIDADPLFVRNPDPVNADYGDLRLRAGSPCIDAGSNAAVPAGVATDLAGNPRIVDGDLDGTPIVDLGAYELQASANEEAGEHTQDLMDAVKHLVDLGAVLPANGRSLYAKLDAAIAALQAGDTATAISDLQAFINQVKALVKTGRLSPSDGQALIDQAEAIIALLGG